MSTIALSSGAWDRRASVIAGTLGLAAFLTQFDVTAVVVAMPAIGQDLGIGMPSLAWVIDAYSLAFTAALLSAGTLADRFGRRRSLLLGNALFLATSLVCSIAWSPAVLWASRAGQGIGAAFVVTGAIASISTAFPEPRLRARAFGLVGVLSGVAMALGPSLGGLLATWLGWRSIFLVNIAPCLLIAVAVPRCVAEALDEAQQPLDWLSVALLTGALGLGIEGLLQVRVAPAGSAAALAVGVVLLAGFGARQRRQAQPMFDPTVFGSRAMIGVAALLLAVSVGYWAVLVYLPLFLTSAFGWSSDRAGLVLLAATVPMLVLPPLGGRFAHDLGWRHLFAAALAVMAIGNALMTATAWSEAPALPILVIGMIASGIGAALAHPQLSGAVVALAPPNAAGMASAITVVARQAGFALGVAALGVVAPINPNVGAYAWVFGLAAFAAVIGLAACALLPGARRKPANAAC